MTTPDNDRPSAPQFAGALLLIDTDVASWLLARKAATQHQAWREALLGRPLVIAVQTRAELLALPLTNNWGERRAAELRTAVDGVPAVPVDDAVQNRYAALTAWGRTNGHAIGQKDHAADRWIAATALAHDLELASGDAGFDGIAGLHRFPSPVITTRR